MDKFTTDYLTCALWSSTGADDEPLDKSHSISDLAPEALSKAVADCARFQADNLATLALADLKAGHAGHCFWLSRCGHGSGYFDEHSITSCPNNSIGQLLNERKEMRADCTCSYCACQRLQDAAQKFGNVDLYQGDDGRLYLS